MQCHFGCRQQLSTRRNIFGERPYTELMSWKKQSGAATLISLQAVTSTFLSWATNLLRNELDVEKRKVDHLGLWSSEYACLDAQGPSLQSWVWCWIQPRLELRATILTLSSSRCQTSPPYCAPYHRLYGTVASPPTTRNALFPCTHLALTFAPTGPSRFKVTNRPLLPRTENHSPT